VLVIGGLTYFFSQPKLRTVEYHKAKLRVGETSRLPKWARRHVPSAVLRWEDAHASRELEWHREALVKLGYLERRTFVISNRTTYEVLRRFSLMSRGLTNTSGLEIRHMFPSSPTNHLMLFGARDEMGGWVKIFREADAPLESGRHLEERTFVLSNRFPYQARPLRHALEPYFTNIEFRCVALIDSGTNTLTFRGPSDELGEVEKAVREFDVLPESAE
jgi:hypothetical protein